MKSKKFKELLDSIGQDRKIHAGKLKAARVTKFNPDKVKNGSRSMSS